MKKDYRIIFLSLTAALCITACGMTNQATEETATQETTISDSTAQEATSATVENTDAKVSITNDIVGLAFTASRTNLKNTLWGDGSEIFYYDDTGNLQTYSDLGDISEEDALPGDQITYSGSVVISVEGVESDLLDTSSANIAIAEGNQYYMDDYDLNTDAINIINNKDGTVSVTLSEGAISLHDFVPSYNGDDGRKWSIFGGDGNGVYHINLLLSGLTYDGKTIASQEFTVPIYIYGRSATDHAYNAEYKYQALSVNDTIASGLKPSDETQWTWISDNQENTTNTPYLNDEYTDYFVVTWPDGTDVSSLTSDDVTITLSDNDTETRVLKNENDYGEQEFQVFTNDSGETVVAVTYEQWAWWPVYRTMTISIANGTLSTEKTFDVTSVYCGNMTQTGGKNSPYLMVWNYSGVENMSIGNDVTVSYTVKVQNGDETLYYDGNTFVNESDLPTTESVDLAGDTSTVPDCTDVLLYATQDNDPYGVLDYYSIVVGGGHTVYQLSDLDDLATTIDVDGMSYDATIEMEVNVDLSKSTLLPGYNRCAARTSQWAWTPRYQSGWTENTTQPTGLPYVGDTSTYGYGFDASKDGNPVYALETLVQ